MTATDAAKTGTAQAARQYVRDLIAREYPWAKLDEVGDPDCVIEFSSHDLIEAFVAGTAMQIEEKPSNKQAN